MEMKWTIIIVNYHSCQSRLAIIKPINVSLRFPVENEISTARRRWNTALRFVGTFTPRIFQELPHLSLPCLRVTPLATLIHFPAFCWNFAYLILAVKRIWKTASGLKKTMRKREMGEEEVVGSSDSLWLETRHTTLLRLIEGSAN